MRERVSADKTFKVYTAGPMTGLKYDEIQCWRDQLQKLLPNNIDCYNPTRGKDFLKKVGALDDSYPQMGALSGSRAIADRDRYDVRSSDLIFVNLSETTKVSIGTVMEIAWAKAYDIPVVLLMEEGNIHTHSMINECISFKVKNLEEAAFVINSVLNPY